MLILEGSVPVDKVLADVIVLPFFEDERPLRGIAGLADWRMSGALSRLILNETIVGREGDSLLMTTDGRMSTSRLMLYGLGSSERFDGKRFQGILSTFVGTLERLRLSRLAITIPGSSMFSMKKVKDAVISEFENAGLPKDSEVIILG